MISVAGIADDIIVGNPTTLGVTFDILTLPDASSCYDLATGSILRKGNLEITLEVKAVGCFGSMQHLQFNHIYREAVLRDDVMGREEVNDRPRSESPDEMSNGIDPLTLSVKFIGELS
jgi:hypothetical protein